MYATNVRSTDPKTTPISSIFSGILSTQPLYSLFSHQAVKLNHFTVLFLELLEMLLFNKTFLQIVTRLPNTSYLLIMYNFMLTSIYDRHNSVQEIQGEHRIFRIHLHSKVQRTRGTPFRQDGNQARF